MSFNNLEYQRKYIASYKQTTFGKYSIKISEIKRKARFYYKTPDISMTLTTDAFLSTLDKFSHSCACCNSKIDIIPCLVTKMSEGGIATIQNTIPMCKSCVRSYHANKKLNFMEWYRQTSYYNKGNLDFIINHTKRF